MTDAGFKVPWLKALRNNGRHYFSRVRGTAHLFLCGDDKYTGKNFDHRREWLVDRHLKGEQLDKPSLLFFNEIIAKWRERLYAILGTHPSGCLRAFKFIPYYLWEGRITYKE